MNLRHQKVKYFDSSSDFSLKLIYLQSDKYNNDFVYILFLSFSLKYI